MKKILLLSVLTVMLTACTGTEVRTNLGLNRRSPDAFNVVSRPPLTVPKEFFLEPPTLGAETTFGPKADEKARAILTGSPSLDSVTPSTQAETELLNKAGVAKADPNVKKSLRDEAWQQEKAKEDASLVDEFRDGLSGGTNKDAPIDPKKEAQALKAKNIPTTLPVE